MNEIVKLGLTLFIITTIAAGLLSVSNAITADRIAELDKIMNDLAMQEVLEGAEEFKPLDEDKFNDFKSANSNVIEVNEGYDSSSNLVGHTIKANTRGFGGEIVFMIGISTDGDITGIKILTHEETPGLGANAEKKYFTDSFKGKPVSTQLVSAKNPQAENEVQAITSATVTTNGIVNGVNSVLEAYNTTFSN